MTFEEATTYLLQRAKEMGVDAEILADESRELTLGAFEGTLNETTQATQGGIGLRVVIDGKVGYASTEERSTAALDWALAEAKENADLQTRGDAFLPEGQALGKHDLLSEGLSAPVEEKAAKALALEADLRRDPRLKQVQMARYSEYESTGSLASTKGASSEYRTGLSLLMGYFIMQEGESLKEGMEYDAEAEFHALEPGRTALKALERTGRLLGAKPLKTGRYDAYFEPKAVVGLLNMLLYMLSGKNVAEGKSRLAGKLGEKVFSEKLTLRDDPTLATGLARRPFDSEGTPAAPVTLIERGVLRSFLHNSETARATQQTNTGHASRSYKGSLGVSASNLMLEPGDGVTLERGVIITDLMGLHAGANPVSGDLSLQAFGLLVEGGEIAHPVENFAFSGNLLSMLGQVAAVGGELEWELRGSYVVSAPMVMVPAVSFAGA